MNGVLTSKQNLSRKGGIVKMENVMNNENLSPDELQHWGIKGMKWGVRRFQKKDGTLTDEGKKRYSDSSEAETETTKTSSTTAKKTNPLDGVDINTYKVRKLPDGVECDRSVDYSISKDKPTEKDIDEQIEHDNEFRDEYDITIFKPMTREEAKNLCLTGRATDLVWAAYDYAYYAAKNDPSYAKDAAVLYERSKKVAHKVTDESHLYDYKHGDSWLEAYWGYADHMKRMNYTVYDFDGKEDDDIYYSDSSDDELQHWGIKGMKWGIRRYQNKDGSLTPEGEKRRKSLGERYHDHKVNKKRKEALEKARAAKVAKKEAEEKAKVEAEKREKAIKAGLVPVKKMTDAELADHLNRLNNEKRYKELQLELSPTRKLMNKMYNDAVIPGLTNAGKNIVDKYVTKTVSDYLGIDKKTKSEYEKLKEQADMSKWRKEIRENNDTEYQKMKAEAEKSKWSKQMLDDEHDKFFINEKLKAAKKGEVYKTPEEKEKLRKAEEKAAEKERKQSEAKAEKDRAETEGKAETQKQVDKNGSTKTDNLPSDQVRGGQAELYDSDGNFIRNAPYTDLDDDD